MKTLNLNEYGVAELNAREMGQTDGGLAATGAAAACTAFGVVGGAAAGVMAICGLWYATYKVTKIALEHEFEDHDTLADKIVNIFM